jgi:hypothetical protein
MIDSWLYSLAIWASIHRVDWLHTLIYKFRCPYPLIDDHSVRACIASGNCGCNNNPALSRDENGQ